MKKALLEYEIIFMNKKVKLTQEYTNYDLAGKKSIIDAIFIYFIGDSNNILLCLEKKTDQ